MRLPRNIKMLRGPIDPSALAGTLFLLWSATFMHSSLVLPAGVRLDLPEANQLRGEVLPQLSVAIDKGGRLLFQQQIVPETNLQVRLREQTALRGTNQTLLVLADRKASVEVVARIMNLARHAGVQQVILATSPGPGPAPGPQRSPHP